jgi:SPP1 family predicted phage head-tail adaptor
MLFKEIIQLISVTKTQNAVTGRLTETEGTPKQVFADEKSITQTEFYQAQASGLRPEIKFIMRKVDYSDEKRLTFNSVKYDIIRTYSKNGELIELICQKVMLGA